MSPDKQQILLSDLPNSLIDKISSVLHSYSTGLIKILGTTSEHGKIELAGSGTFISVDGVYGILTADHVSKEMGIDDTLSLLLDSHEHRYSIPKRQLTIIEIARGPIESEGPDLSFIVFSPDKAAEIRSYKQFFDLTLHRTAMLNNPPENYNGMWFIQGMVNEMTTEENSPTGLGRVKSFHSVGGPVAFNREYSQEHQGARYDYIEVLVEHGNPQVPHSFGGTSGGGLWQVRITRAPDGHFQSSNYNLCGLAFYQSEIRNGFRPIICHGQRSLYEIAYDKIKG